MDADKIKKATAELEELLERHKSEMLESDDKEDVLYDMSDMDDPYEEDEKLDDSAEKRDASDSGKSDDLSLDEIYDEYCGRDVEYGSDDDDDDEYGDDDEYEYSDPDDEEAEDEDYEDDEEDYEGEEECAADYPADLEELDPEMAAAILALRKSDNYGSRNKRAKEERKERKKKRGVTAGGLHPSEGLLAAFGMPIIIMIIIFVQRKIFPFGEQSFLRTDMYHQYAPFFSEFRHKLTEGGSLLYSWNIGLGVNFSALYAYYLASPLNWFLILCPKNLIIEFMTYSIVLKIGLSGLSFAYYLKKHCEKSDFGIAFFGIFYALSGYMAAYSWNIMWLDCILLFPLIVLGLERLVKEKKGLLYSVTLGIAILSNYYISIMICIFMVLYFVGLLILDHSSEEGFGRYIVNIFQFGIYSLLAGGMAGVVLLPEIYALKVTASGDVNFPKTFSSYFSIFDMFARHIGNIDIEIGLDHWPNIYCGVAVLMFFLLYLGCKKVAAREKMVYCGLLFIFFASFAINALNFIWHGFHYPNSLPCRQSFIYIFLMLYICYEAYIHLKDTEWKHVTWAFFGAVGFVILAEKLVEQKHFEFYVYYVAIIFLALYGWLIYLYKRCKTDYGVVMLLALAVVCVEASVNTTITSVTTTSRTAYIKDNEDVRQLTESLDVGNTFYRVEKVTRKTKNDGAWMNFPSVSLFSSVADARLTAFVKAIGCEGNINSYSITGSTPFIDSLLSVKYGLYSSEQFENDNLMLVDQSNDTYLYMRYNTLPLGFMLPAGMETDWQLDLGNPAYVQNDFGDAVGAGDMLVDIGGENSGDTYKFTAPEAGDYYVYISNTQVKKVKMTRDESSRTFDNVNRGFLLEIGWCEPGDEVTLTNDEAGQALKAQGYRFDFNELRTVYITLSQYPLEVTNWTDTTVDGVVTTDYDGILFTSIPYDEGWTVTVDGEVCKGQLIFDAFLGIPMTKGNHTVSLSYMPQGLMKGAWISAVCAAILLVIYLIGRAKNPSPKKEKAYRPEET